MPSTGPRKKKTLGRGMEDLLGGTFETLVSGSEVPVEPQGPAPLRDTRGTAPGPPPPAPAIARSEGASGSPIAGPTRPQAHPAVTPRPCAHARVFAVASGKGGTGKSLIAVNLAVALAARRRVCLVDADMGLANAHILLGLLPRYNVGHLLSGERSVEEVLAEGPRGLLLLPGASGLPEMASLDDARLDRFAASIAPVLSRCDAAILDCPAGLSRQSLLLLHGADVIVVVTTDDLTSMTDAYALIKTVASHRPNAALGLLVNDARSAADGSETHRRIGHVARKFLGRDIVSLGTIPRDPLLERSVAQRRPVLLSHPSSPAAKALEDLGERLWAFRGLDPSLGFADRLRRTLAAAAPRSAAASGNGDRPCA